MNELGQAYLRSKIRTLETTLDSTLAENALLRCALEPFAKYAQEIDGNSTSRDIPDEAFVRYDPMSFGNVYPNVGDCRKAREALSTSNSKALELLRDRERLNALEVLLMSKQSLRMWHERSGEFSIHGVRTYPQIETLGSGASIREAIDSAMAVKEGE